MKEKATSPSQPTPRPDAITTGTIAICLTGILLGTIPLFKGILIQNFCCSSIAFFRVATAFLSISLFVIVKHLLNGTQGRFLIQRKHIWSFIGYGAISIAAVNYFYLKSLTCTSTAIAVVTVFVAAPLTTLAVSFFTDNRRNKREIFFILLIVIGCIMVNMQTNSPNTQWDGIIYATIAGICYGLFSIFGRNIAEDYDYPVMMFWQFLIATIATFIAMLLLGEVAMENIFDMRLITISNVLSILGIGVISTFIPYLMYSYGLRNGVPSTTASALTLLEPISGTIIAFAFLNEMINLLQAFGILVVILFSVLLASKKSADFLFKDTVLQTKQI
jgi:drug/metabolite transporter (DMT)-like permease